MIRTEPAPHVDKMEHTPRVGIRLHPLCELFPELSGAAFNELRDDIAKNGVLEPIVFIGDEILDGRNRYFAARELGIEYPRVQFTGDDPKAFVIAKNLARRHLTESQRSMVAAKLAKMPAHRPTEDNSANLRTSEAADMLNVSARSVETARKVINEGAPELVAAVEAGQVAVSAAAEIVDLPKEEQAKAVADGTVKDQAKARREKRAEKPAPAAPAKRTVVPIAEFEAVEAERDELREERDALLKDVADLKAELATYADMKLEYERGGFAEIIGNKDQVISAQAAALARESQEKVRNLNTSEMWRKRAEEAGWSNDVVIPIPGRAAHA